MLHNLVQYAKREGIVGESGFTQKNIRWMISFNQKGDYLGISNTSPSDSKKNVGRIFDKVPHLQFSGDTPMRQFLVDTAQYILLYDVTTLGDKLLNKHNYAIDLLKEASGVMPILGKIADALNDELIRSKICEDLKKLTPKATAIDNVSFATEEGPVVEKDVWHEWWRSYFPTLFKKKGTALPMRCFMSGKISEPALTHPKIKNMGDIGGKSETSLISFNADSFCSYGLSQSTNAAICCDMAEQYAAVINSLIQNKSKKLIGTKILYWYIGDVIDSDDPIPCLFGESVFDDLEDVAEQSANSESEPNKREALQAERKVAELLDAVKTGRRPELSTARYFALTLSANSARVVVRDWIEGSFQELLENIDAWFADTAIVERDGKTIKRSHKLKAILAAPVRELKDVNSAFETAVWHSAIKGYPLPYSMMVQTLNRVKIDIIQDEPPRTARYGVLKAYCNRKKGVITMTEELNEYLDDPAYLSGCIMALLAKIQLTALPDVGAGIVQRYYAAASTNPGLILGRLVRLAQIAHLPKIASNKPKLSYWFENELADKWAKLKQSPPAVLTLEQQTLFAMGYYQQKAKRKESEQQQ